MQSEGEERLLHDGWQALAAADWDSISRRTAEHHVASSISELGLRSRSEA